MNGEVGKGTFSVFRLFLFLTPSQFLVALVVAVVMWILQVYPGLDNGGVLYVVNHYRLHPSE